MPTPAPTNSAGTIPSVALGVPDKDTVSAANSKIVLDAVRVRFPEWADPCQPYVNVLTLKAWNQRGYRVKKGEKAIRVFTDPPLVVGSAVPE